MKKPQNLPKSIDSATELHRLLDIAKPAHPLVSVINLAEINCMLDTESQSWMYNFYSICIKKNYTGKLKYGQNFYDFDEGVMTFFAPGQIIATSDSNAALNGWWLTFHPDFLRGYALARTIQNYGYFSYAVNEALHVSEKEEGMIVWLFSANFTGI